MRIPQGWLDELKESPQFIKTTLLDVKRATSIITQKVDKIAQELEQNVGEKQENGAAAKEKTFYSSVAYLQFSDDTRQLDELRDKGDYEGLLMLAKEYYDGNGINENILIRRLRTTRVTALLSMTRISLSCITGVSGVLMR